MGVYGGQDAVPQYSAELVAQQSDATLPEPDVGGGTSPSDSARLTSAREAEQALAAHGTTIERLDMRRLITKEFEKFDPNYLKHYAQREMRLDKLKRLLMASAESGKALPCSRRMMIEAEWLLDYTAEWETLDRKLNALEASLAIKHQDFAMRQAPDGSWGACYDAWFEKINGTLDAINLLPVSTDEAAPVLPYPFTILRKIDSSRALITYLYGLQLSQIAKTGIYQREELGAIEGALSQMLFKEPLRAILQANGATFADPAYVNTYRDFLDDTQDPISGYWGPWIMTEDGIIRAADLSFTFHVVSYRKGAVHRWPQIIETTLAIKDLPYPFGWRHNGQYNNHNNYDVVKILRLGWPHMTSAEIGRARAEIHAMLKWSLDKSITPDGEFRDDPSFYDSVGEAYYYGVSFLDEVGYWNKAQRFWDDNVADYAGAADLCRKIESHLATLKINSRAAQDALTKLSASCHGEVPQ